MPELRRPGAASIVAIILVALLVVAMLLTPSPQDSRGNLTSYSTAPGGARALYELQLRSGWDVERMMTSYGNSLDTTAVYAVLDPPLMVTANEVHVLLQAVRAGAGLLAVIPASGPLADSLAITRSRMGGGMYDRDEAPAGFCADSLDRRGLINWPTGHVQSWWLVSERTPARQFARVTALDSAPRRLRTRPAMAGYTVGRGRVVAVADPDLLRNDVLRVCSWNAGPNAAQALDWLAVSGGRRLIFDEYHHNLTAGPAPMRAVRRALMQQPWGRMILAITLGGLVMLAAAGMRPMAPEELVTVQRRSPLEHVQALAHAYASAGSTRLVARRLARGLRRRHSLAAPSGGDDNDFLDALATRRPALAPDIATLQSAMTNPIPPDELPALGNLVASLDSRLRPHR